MAGTILAGPKKRGVYTATFGIGNGFNQPVANDVCPPYEVEVGGTVYVIEARSNKPGAGALFLDFKKSGNLGTTWSSLFAPGQKLTLLANSTQLVRVTLLLAEGGGRVVAPNDWLRADVLVGSSADWQNVSAWVRWA